MARKTPKAADQLQLPEPYRKEMEGLIQRLATAKEVVSIVSQAHSVGMELKIPLSVMDWSQSVFEEYLRTMSTLTNTIGLNTRLVDRNMFDPTQVIAPDWNDGITLQNILPNPEALSDGTIAEILDIGEPVYNPYGEFGLSLHDFRRFTNRDSSEEPLSPQYNRFLPLKIVMRVAANLLLHAEGVIQIGEKREEAVRDPLYLEDLRQECAKVARYAKERMQWIDSAKGTDYGSWFSVALTDGSTKQDERFMVQFVGSTRNHGQGLPFELGYLWVDKDGAVSLTREGLEFVVAENPIIDRKDGWKEGETLSQTERLLLSRAINRNVPGEKKLLHEMMELIRNGKNTPSDIEAHLIKKGHSQSEASVIRTGHMARMQDLGIILRTKTGRKVTYSLANASVD
jgi:hypothetical protein